MSLKMMGAGWMEARLRCGRRTIHLFPGYTTDVLGGLLAGTLELIESCGLMEVHPEKGPAYDAPLHLPVYWDCEPGNYRWDLTYVSTKELSISFSEILPGKKKPRENLLFETEISANTWCEMLLSNAARILRRRGLAGYHAGWMGSDFPVGAYLRLLAYRKKQFQLGSAADDFLPSEKTSLSHDLGVLRREALARPISRPRR